MSLLIAVTLTLGCCATHPRTESDDPSRARHKEPYWWIVADGYPLAAVQEAACVLNRPIIHADRLERPWLSRKVFVFTDEGDERVVFLQKKGDYVQVNSLGELTALNTILSEYPFAKEDFKSTKDVHNLLSLLSSLTSRTVCQPGSSVLLSIQERVDCLDDWLKGTEGDEEVFRGLCNDPAFLFDGTKWKVSFNAFRTDGGVDKWEVAGEYRSVMRSNTVYTIDVSRVLPKATFSCPHLFWGEDLPGASIRKILDQLPRELVSKAEKALPGRIADAGELDQYAEWFPGKIFYFADEYWLKARFLQRQNGYIQLNCPSGMSGINEILATYRFERADFGDPLKVLLFLRLVKLYDNGLPSDIGQTRALMNILRNDYRLNTWLGGTEKDEGVFKRLYRDPQILLEGNEWTIIYNVFKFNGGVDQWRLSGAHDPVMHTNQIQSIDIRPLKPKGTFWHPLK